VRVLSLAVYLHRIDPFAIEIANGIGIRWYGLSYLAGFLAAYGMIRWAARRRVTPLPESAVGDFVLAVAIGTVVGGRLGYCLFYQPALFVTFTDSVPFWGMLAINQGGMASHGGIIGIVLACLWYARKQNLPALHLIDLAAATGPLGVVFGRLANFINGELYGRACEASSRWAVKFPQEMLVWSAERLNEPQVIEARRRAAELFNEQGLASPTKLIEAVRQNDQVASLIEPLLTPRYPSQLFQAGMEGLLVFVFLIALWYRPRKPGVITGAFLTGYAVMRIIGEQFRMPDHHLGYGWLGLTRGQWLSAAMLAVGLALWVYWSRRHAAPMGGWGTAPPESEASSTTRTGSEEA